MNMKKLILLTLGVIGFVGITMAATQPLSLGVVDASLRSLTQAQVLASTSTKAGQMIYCSNCSANGGAGTICISTGTTGFNPFVLSTGTVCR
jgi:hypothetical protein